MKGCAIKMLKIIKFRKPCLLHEAKEDQVKFISWATSKDKDDIQSYIQFYLDNRKAIQSPYNDFYYWIKKDSIDDFIKFVDDKMKDKQAKQSAKEGARLAYSDKDWKVYEITNYEAAKKYGANTKWCISGSKVWSNGENGEYYFNSYHDNRKVKFYFFIKNNEEKYALAIYPNNMFEIFDSEDNAIEFIPYAPKIDEIPSEVTYTKALDKDVFYGEIDKVYNAILDFKLPQNILNYYISIINKFIDNYSIDVYYNVDDFISQLDKLIPDGYLESESNYEEWTGDLPQIAFIDGFSLSYGIDTSSKEALLDKSNFKRYKCFYLLQDYYDNKFNFGMTAMLNDLFDDIADSINFYLHKSSVEEFFNEYNSVKNGDYSDLALLVINELFKDVISDATNAPDNFNPKEWLKSTGVSDEFIKFLESKEYYDANDFFEF